MKSRCQRKGNFSKKRELLGFDLVSIPSWPYEWTVSDFSQSNGTKELSKAGWRRRQQHSFFVFHCTVGKCPAEDENSTMLAPLLSLKFSEVKILFPLEVSDN